MRKKLLFLGIAAVMSLCAWAEKPSDTLEKHGDKTVFFFKPYKGVSAIPGFTVERIAVNDDVSTFYIKTREKDYDLVWTVVERIDMGADYILFVRFLNGDFGAVDKDCNFIYMKSNRKDGAVFSPDFEAHDAYNAIRGK